MWSLRSLGGAHSGGTIEPLPISFGFSLANEGNTITSDDRVSVVANPYTRGGTMAQAVDAARPRLIYFDTGPCFHLAGGAVRMQSSLAAAAWKDLHDGTSDRTIAVRFRITSLAHNNTLFRTFNETATGSGVNLRITTTGDAQFRVGTGVTNTNMFSGVSAITANTTHTLLIRKEGTALHMYLDDMTEGNHAQSATLSGASSADPQNTLIIGNTASSFLGFMGELLVLDEAADEAMRMRIAERLATHDLQSLLAEVDVAHPPGAITAGATLRKVHASNTLRYTWEVATRLSDDSRDIAVWRFSTRGGGGTTIGACRLRSAVRGNCWDSTRYALAHNDAARSGTWTNAAGTGNFGGCLINDVSRTDGTAGESVTYTVVVPAGGKILWEYVGSAVGGRAHIVIRDSGATEIAGAEYAIPEASGNRYVDTARVSGIDNEVYSTALATVVDADTYTVEITAAGGATWNRLYDRAVYALDTATAGDTAADPWVLGLTAIGTGELSYAADAGSGFEGGAHGGEDPFTDLVAAVDGTGYAAELIAVGSTAADTRWHGAQVTLGFATELTAGWAALDYTFTLDRYGCTNAMRRTMLAAANLSVEYIGMLQAPNLVNSGFDRVAIDVEPREYFQVGTTTPVTTQTEQPSANNGAAFYTDTFAAIVRCRVPTLAGTDGNSVTPALLTDRNDGELKDYRAIVRQDLSSNPLTVHSGQVRTWSARYRCVPGSGLFTLIGT